ncbi:hypothetical protein [Bradyrhizobium sp.]|jgi:hypothetical protein|uniref:hypothetical protein n=1 Tax=Bradyrhizobium sp. TaxID=376 RepID=UPI002D7F0A5D|nr:hypothetical protein [Bradyrhizobium sp.]
MEQTLLLFLCCCVGFMSGYGIRAMISLRHRREARKMSEARERLMRVRASSSQTDLMHGHWFWIE